jgi:hypothetical protein
MFPGTPKAWLIGAGLVCVALFLGAAHLRYTATLSRIEASAERKGAASAQAATAMATLDAVAQTAAAERAAEDEVGPLAVPADIIALCKRSASCKERRTLK